MKSIVIKDPKSLKALFYQLVEASLASDQLDEKDKQNSTENDLNKLFSGDSDDSNDKSRPNQEKNKIQQEPDKKQQQTSNQKGDISLDQVIDKWNLIRGGKSFKEQNVKTQLEKYWNEKLDDAEKMALYTFSKAISQIVSAAIEGNQAVDPSSPPPEGAGIKMKQTSKENVKHVKPNVVKKGASGEIKKPASKENTLAPKKVSAAPIQPRVRQ